MSFLKRLFGRRRERSPEDGPAHPREDDLWLDSRNGRLKRRLENRWVIVPEIRFFAQDFYNAPPPRDARIGDVWRLTNGETYAFTGTIWQLIEGF